VVYMPGGTAFYFSQAIHNMTVKHGLVTAVAPAEMPYVKQLMSKGIPVKALPSTHTVYFENSYTSNPDHRTQRVLAKADTFTSEQLADVNANIFHLGPLLADDFEKDIFKDLAARGTVSLDAQGLLRKVEQTKVLPTDWPEKAEALPYVQILKANEEEVAVLTGQNDIREGAKILAAMGVKEVVITLGSEGSFIYADGEYHDIPVYLPAVFKDATGCGDTYMAGYLYKRAKGADVAEAGCFASAMAGIKAGISGPFTGTEDEVMAACACLARV
jgi:sugar/nucleoside kinase (ribokinase family)